MNEFKFIWHMEYGHRMWGRAIGAFFLFPAVYFWAKGKFTPAMKQRVFVFGSLILSQVLLQYHVYLHSVISFLGSHGMVHGEIWIRRSVPS